MIRVRDGGIVILVDSWSPLLGVDVVIVEDYNLVNAEDCQCPCNLAC